VRKPKSKLPPTQFWSNARRWGARVSAMLKLRNREMKPSNLELRSPVSAPACLPCLCASCIGVRLRVFLSSHAGEPEAGTSGRILSCLQRSREGRPRGNDFCSKSTCQQESCKAKLTGHCAYRALYLLSEKGLADCLRHAPRALRPAPCALPCTDARVTGRGAGTGSRTQPSAGAGTC
jgi:hypothetical protein